MAELAAITCRQPGYRFQQQREVRDRARHRPDGGEQLEARRVRGEGMATRVADRGRCALRHPSLIQA
jgi:hypothetical protein